MEQMENSNTLVTDETVKAWCDLIRAEAFDLHTWQRNGQRESVYETGMFNRIGKLGFEVQRQHPIEVRDRDGSLLGDFYVDLFVNDDLIIELKAVKTVTVEHIAQLLAYLRATGIRHGLLINFGASIVQVRKFVI